MDRSGRGADAMDPVEEVCPAITSNIAPEASPPEGSRLMPERPKRPLRRAFLAICRRIALYCLDSSPIIRRCPLNRTELIDAVSADTGLTRQQAEAAIEAVVYEITSGVKAGDPVRITGFGTFKLRERQARRGRNPQTGAAVRIKASKGIGFTPGVKLKADLNARGAVAKPKTAAPVKKAAVPAKKVTATVAKATRVAKKAPAAAPKRAAAVKKAAAPAKKATKTVAKKATRRA